ncbi:FAD-binding dehydrogenase [Spongiactinospora gelatinilytica]|uniref:FAD-binding dehydrogenase n=1 Tax=Spongiactinospora gelatinilytica TaxID=2666298 RepID=A0A2W2ES77_9ACTN|nr:FAD-binding dehydrogenase [Spongiactinospora gelatinilytica]
MSTPVTIRRTRPAHRRRARRGVTDADVVVVGAGIAGLAATAELAEAGRTVVLVDQQGRLGGQALWSSGGLFMIDTPEQRRMGIRDSTELAWQDWLGTAGFDRGVQDPEGQDFWAVQWARAFVEFASGELRAWLRAQGVRWFPLVYWHERGAQLAGGQGNSVPRLHITRGTGPGLLAPLERRVRAAVERGTVRLRFGHRVDELVVTAGAVTGVRGTIRPPDCAATDVAVPYRRAPVAVPCATASSEAFEISAQAVIVTSGGIGGDQALVRANWPPRLGPPPRRMLAGVPGHVDGRMLAISERAGARLVNSDRMWHLPEGIRDGHPIWAGHGTRILAGPSALWLDACGHRLPAPNFPGVDTLTTLRAIAESGHDHSWFVLTRKIAERELALAGAAQNPDLTGRDPLAMVKRLMPRMTPPLRAFLSLGADSVVAPTLPKLVEGMNDLTGQPLIRLDDLKRQIELRDREIGKRFAKDAQLTAIRDARRYLGNRLIFTAAPHRILDPGAGPLIAVRLTVLTRETLGGLQTDLSGRVLRPDGDVLPGLYAAGEAAGFGGGGMHGYRALEGGFLGGCLFSGRRTGRAVAHAT